MSARNLVYILFFFNDTATTEIYTLSLHDALPICANGVLGPRSRDLGAAPARSAVRGDHPDAVVHRVGDQQPPAAVEGERSEEHTSELQSRQYLVCRLLLEKKKRTDVHIDLLRHPL